MNKQILKLFNEAGFHQPEMERLGIEDKFEKFAESIIAECLYLCESTAAGRDAEAIQAAIREHFGVDG